MKPRVPAISAQDPAELRAKLAATPIAVARRPERRTHVSREKYSALRALATLSESRLLSFPLTIEFRDGPDVALHMPTGSIGIECIDAIAEEWAEILDLRAREYPNEGIFLPRLQPGVRSLRPADIRAYASGVKAAPPRIGDEIERDWSQAILYFADKKLAKLRRGAYPNFSKNWLLIHDEWVMRPVTAEKQRLAASLLAAASTPLFCGTCFSEIFVEGSKWLTCLSKASVDVTAIVNLWD